MGDSFRTDVLIVGAGPSGYVALSDSFETKSMTGWTNCRLKKVDGGRLDVPDGSEDHND